MIPSKYQEAIFRFVSDATTNGLIEAVAGSGKTTTIVDAAKRIHKDGNGSLLGSMQSNLFVAFNKHIATELQRRLPDSCEASTLHALGYRLCREQLKTKTVFDKKSEQSLVKHLGDPWKQTDQKVRKQMLAARSSAIRMISIAKATLCAHDPVSLQETCDRYSIDVADPSLLQVVGKVLTEHQAETSAIDFDDMLWLPVQYALAPPQHDLIFVDEAQDLNATQAMLLTLANSRTILVGDRFQSLYGFRGADPDAIPNLIDKLSCETMPLSICYRCPTEVIKMAQRYVPAIEAWEHAETGLVETISSIYLHEKAKPGDMIICRLNAPLIFTALMLIRHGTKVTVRGRDIGQGIAKTAEKWFCNGISKDDAKKQMRQWLAEQTSKPISNARYQKIMDEISVIEAVCDFVERASDVPQQIMDLFSDERSAITLSSIHRAKGLEADRVFILPYEDTHAEGRAEWEVQQEKNAVYVAITRARRELYFVEA